MIKKRGKTFRKSFIKKDRKAQFYLIAAVIIVVIILGLATMTNYAIKRKKPVKFYDLGSELREEGARVVDYGIYEEEDIPELIKNFTDEYLIKKRYVEEKEKEAELVFIYGNKDGAVLTAYTSQATGKIAVTSGGTDFTISGVNKYERNENSLGAITEDIEIELLNVTYNFTLQEGENFLFIITKKTEDETHVIRG